MNEKAKRVLKTTGIIAGVCTIGAMAGLSWIGLGILFQEQYHDPDNYLNSIWQYARYGWSAKLNDGWAA